MIGQKHLWGLLVALWCATALPLQAQQEAATDSLTALARQQTEQMVKRYGLNEEQKATVQRLNVKYQKDMALLRGAIDPQKANDAQKAELKAAYKDVEAQYDAVLKDVLSEKQFAKYQDDAAKQRAKEQEANNAKVAPFGPMVMGGNTVSLLGFGAQESDSTTIARKQTDKMVKKYKLNEEQASQLMALNMAEVKAELDERKEMADFRNMDSEKFQELSNAAKKRTENYEKYLKEILTEAQYKKYTNAKKARQSRGPRFGGPPPGMGRPF